MQTSVWIWIEFILAFFFTLFMVLSYSKYREYTFKLLGVIFSFSLIKSIIYLSISLTDVNWTSTIIQGVTRNILDPVRLPLYNMRYLIYQFLETVYTLLIYYFISINILKAQESKTLKLNIILIANILLLSIPVSFVVIYSLRYGNSETFYKTNNAIVELSKGILGRSFYVSWKIILLIMTWGRVNQIIGYVASLLKIISKYRKLLYYYLTLQILLTFMSAFVAFYAYPVWLFFNLIPYILFCVFAYGQHTGYIDSLHEKIENLEKEKDTTIQLMREIGGTVTTGTFELEPVLKTIVENSIKGTGARGAAILLKDPITNRLIVRYVKGLFPPTKPIKTTPGVTLTEAIIVEKFKAEKIAPGEGLLGKVLETGEGIYIPDVDKEPSFLQTASEHIYVKSFVAVPLKTRDEVFGVLAAVSDTKILLESDASLLETLGEQAAIIITQFQMYQEILEKKQAEKELGVAAEIQSSLIPHTFPSSPRFEVYGFSIPAKGVGGDYYDYIDFGNDKIVLTMFDVSGKGVPAALIMVMIRSILRTIATLNDDTKDVMAKLNNTIASEIVEDRYATGFYLLFDAEKGIMSYTNAGHCPMILYRASTDEFEFLDTEGMPIGIMSGVEYGQNYTVVEKGDIAILYTDGITEAMNSKHEEFGFERLKEVIRERKRESSKEICNRILEAINLFVGSAPQHDDETILVLKMK